MAIHYLDASEEITGAVARLRTERDPRVLLVLPPGSRISTSRINFRLLAREAKQHQRQLAIAASEQVVRAVAVSAGLPAYATVAEYEAAYADAGAADPFDPFEPSPGRGPGPISRGRPARPVLGERPREGVGAPFADEWHGGAAVVDDPADATAVEGSRASRLAAAAGASSGGALTAGSRPAHDAWEDVTPNALDRTAGLRRGGRGAAAAILLLVAACAAAAALAFVVLPAAAITVTPRTDVAGPVRFQVTVDPAATKADPDAGVVPAQQISVPISAHDTFKATGTAVRETKATGTVRFLSGDTVEDVTIPAATVVSTRGGIDFVTDSAVVVPRAQVDPAFVRGQVQVDVAAVAAGPTGNVDAGTVTRLPAALATKLISVSNPTATSGGRHTETAFVTKQDVADAVAALHSALDASLAARLSDPALAPKGVTMRPETVVRGQASADPATDGLAGDRAQTFDLTLRETATITGVDESQIAPLAAARLARAVTGGAQILDGSVRSTFTPDVTRGVIRYSVEATAQVWRPVDSAAVLALVRGKRVGEAATLLARYGDAQITTWPGYVDTIPTLDGRATVTINPPGRAP